MELPGYRLVDAIVHKPNGIATYVVSNNRSHGDYFLLAVHCLRLLQLKSISPQYQMVRDSDVDNLRTSCPLCGGLNSHHSK